MEETCLLLNTYFLILIQLFVHIAAKNMVSSTHKASDTKHVGFSLACCSSDTEQSVQTWGAEGSVLQAAPHLRFQTQVVGAPATHLLSDLDPLLRGSVICPSSSQNSGEP